ncbi:DICER1 [Lepeophtheirus salmonis]|uniref:DICER1 n=1 Tax=Lepeophtheirus salmonis TaxID=72036 RepID=A0A7R8CHD6_LEPSM|nr:DICER1 [Lepeophtheirus salmonis]CAF2766536.1 DICER1 [Lepeophtheirus salmonis]
MEPRNYQLELFDIAKDQNSIVYLGTGSGKTFIAIMMIKEFYGGSKNEEKKIVMVVPSLPLAHQQSRVIDEQCKFARVGKIVGEDGVDLWDSSKWNEVINSLDIIVMIHQVLLDSLSHSFLTLSNISLLIFDECHHTFKDNPYNMIMKEHYLTLKSTHPHKVPHILGLSASVVISQCDDELKFLREKKILEANLDSKIITTMDLDNYLRFVTQPHECLKQYHAPSLGTDISNIVDDGLIKIENEFENHIIFLKQEMRDSKDKISLLTTRAKSKKKLFNRTLNDISMLYNTWECLRQGYMFTQCYKTLFPRSNSDVMKNINSNFCKLFMTHLNLLKGYSKGNGMTSLEATFRKYSQFSMQSFTAVVFVKRRESCKIIYEVLKEILRLDSRFSFISPAYIIGQSMVELNPGSNEMKKMQDTITNFRSGRYNLIVSTSVLEEGMDIKKCNLVIRFDEIDTYRSYVQSKGRARAKPSMYVIMCSTTDLPTMDMKLSSFRKIEQMSITECHTLPFELQKLNDFHEENEDNEEEEDPYFVNPNDKTNSAMISPATSISLLHQYINSITTDKFTTLAPYWEYSRTTSRPHNILLSVLEEPKYVCQVTLPHKTPLNFPVKGALRASRKKAKRSAALQACTMLHQLGELDDKLIPKKKRIHEELEELDDGLDDDEDHAKPGTKRFRRYYAQKKPLLSSSPILCASKVFIYTIDMHLVSITKHNPKRYSLYYPQETEHQGLLNDVLQVVTPWMEELTEKELLECRDPLIVPLLNGEIDKDFILKTISGQPYNDGDMTERVVSLLHKPDPQRYFVEEVIPELTPLSLINENTTFVEYYSQKYGMKITDKSQPLIRLSNADAERFAYSEVVIEEKDNKLTKLGNLDFYRTRWLAIPELVLAHSVPSSFWKDLKLLPYILERINQIQNSMTLLKELCSFEKGEPCSNKDLSFDFLTDLNSDAQTLSFNHFELFKSLTLTNAGEEFDLERNEILGDAFLKIMTSIYLYFAINSKDEGYLSLYRSRIVGNRNLLRVGEMIGDLQLGGVLNAVKLQPKLNWQVPFYNNLKSLEEEIVKMNRDFRKTVLTSNEKFKSHNFLDGMNNSDLSRLKEILCCDNPNTSIFYNDIVNKLSEARGNTNYSESKAQLSSLRVFVPVNDKSIADALESIIGVYLLHYGCKATLRMMATKMGISLFPNVKVENNICGHSKLKVSQSLNWFVPPTNAIQDFGKKVVNHEILNRLLLKSYTFTHSSFSSNKITDSYERLEFLGDAILDYLVTSYIFIEFPTYGPGKVTDARSAVVNNVTLAILTIKSELYCHLLHSEPLILSRIDSMIANMEFDESNMNEFDFFKLKMSLLSETECPILEEVDVPKVLGDICESVLGAVFLDSGFDLKIVWNVFKRLCPNLDQIVALKPKNYVTKLYELFPERISFGPSKKVGNKIEKTVSLRMKDDKVYKARGIGPKGKIAKISACKCLIRGLVKIKELPSDVI